MVYEEACTKECKLCVLHKYGTIFLSAGGLLVIICTIATYWREIAACLSGLDRKPPMNPPPTQPKEAAPDMPSPATTTVADQTLMNSTNTRTAPSAPPVIFNQQPAILPIMTLPNPQPMITSLPAPTPLPPPQAQPPARSERRRKTSSPSQPKQAKQLPAIGPTKDVPAKTTDTNPDPFKLPTPEDFVDGTLKKVESTGSNYFKQMMKGKKVANSISEYALLRKANREKKAKGKKPAQGEDVSKKHGRHHHHKKHKDK